MVRSTVHPPLLLLLFSGAVLGCSHNRQALRGGDPGNASHLGDGEWNRDSLLEQPHPDAFLYQHVAGRRALMESSAFPCASQSPPEDLKRKLEMVHRDWKKANEENRRNLADLQYLIEVVFHVIYVPSKGYVDEATIQSSYLASLQKGFASTPFRFSLRQVTYTENADWYDCDAGNEDDFKQALYVQGKNVLNVYLCDPWSSYGAFGAYAWSSYPVNAGTPQDGIVLMNPSIVDEVSSTQTLVHETGHFLSLLHTFEGGCQPGTATVQGYTVNGDGVTDTPAHYGPTENYVGSDSCWTDYVLNTCLDVQGIDPGPDPTDNYMNYLTPTCWSERGQFTAGQMERMLASYEQYRLSPTSYLGRNGTDFNTTVSGVSEGALNVTGRENNDTLPASSVTGNRWSYAKGLDLNLEGP